MLNMKFSILFFLTSFFLIVKCTDRFRLEKLVKESFSEVSAFIVLHFNERCSLAVHNCLFRTEWDKVFGKDRFDSKYHYLKRSNIQDRNETYSYCQAFVIGRFCIDDYLAKSGDNFECLNGTNGNTPEKFKTSIYRDNCKILYDHFFHSRLTNGSSKFKFFYIFKFFIWSVNIVYLLINHFNF